MSKTLFLIVVITAFLGILIPQYKCRRRQNLKQSIGFKYDENSKYLIRTKGCTIPNYVKYLSNRYNETANLHGSCGRRAVNIRVVPSKNTIRFLMHMNLKPEYEEKMHCCYQFAGKVISGKQGERATYPKCINFQNGTVAKIETQAVNVGCYFIDNFTLQRVVLYMDTFLIFKRRKFSKKPIMRDRINWNVLMVGIDSMSLARATNSLPKTVNYMKSNKWLNFRGYNRVGHTKFTNLMALLTGKMIPSIGNCECCQKGISSCNEMMIWSLYKAAGYYTAYGEDYADLKTFDKGFVKPPTDYYPSPFFLKKEKLRGNILCSGMISSVKQLLEYTHAFAKTHRKDSFFGLFWLNSVGRDSKNLPYLHDDDVTKLLMNIKAGGAMANTFVFLLSDHGVKNKKLPHYSESFYDHNLPMMFVYVPLLFKRIHEEEYHNFISNRNRLVTAYDVYLTLSNILKLSNHSVSIAQSDGCPNCSTLFKKIPSSRICSDAGVRDKLCSCKTVIS